MLAGPDPGGLPVRRRRVRRRRAGPVQARPATSPASTPSSASSADSLPTWSAPVLPPSPSRPGSTDTPMLAATADLYDSTPDHLAAHQGIRRLLDTGGDRRHHRLVLLARRSRAQRIGRPRRRRLRRMTLPHGFRVRLARGVQRADGGPAAGRRIAPDGDAADRCALARCSSTDGVTVTDAASAPSRRTARSPPISACRISRRVPTADERRAHRGHPGARPSRPAATVL